MGCVCSCICRRRKYRKLDHNVVLETNAEETWGIYWFKEIPKVKLKPGEAPVPASFAAMERVHRFSPDIEKKVAIATGIDLKDKKWKTLRADSETGFVMWGFLVRPFVLLPFDFLSFLLAVSDAKGAKQGHGTSRVATLSASHLYAEEIARAFWDSDPGIKSEWDPTVETFRTVENLTDLAYVAEIVFKPIWPATQRDCVICSEMVPLKNDGWAVSNQSVRHPEATESTERIRLSCDVTLVVTQSWKDPEKGTKRDNVVSHLLYSANVDPGGWVPSSLVETLAAREWPRALSGVCETARNIVKREGKENREFYVDCS